MEIATTKNLAAMLSSPSRFSDAHFLTHYGTQLNRNVGSCAVSKQAVRSSAFRRKFGLSRIPDNKLPKGRTTNSSPIFFLDAGVYPLLGELR